MFAKIKSAAVLGLNAVPIDVEVDIAAQGLPSFKKVGTAYQQFRLNLLYEWLELN
jgi:hypothetical protein